MTSIAGIDYDSNGIYAVVVGEETGNWIGKIEVDLACGPGNSFERARRVRELLPTRSAWKDAGVVAIGLEATLSRQRASVAALSRVQGAILATLPRDVPLFALKVNVLGGGWKALTVGKTNASKDDVRAWALEHGAPAGLVQDLYDAFAIARATRELYTNPAARAATRGAA